MWPSLCALAPHALPPALQSSNNTGGRALVTFINYSYNSTTTAGASWDTIHHSAWLSDEADDAALAG